MAQSILTVITPMVTNDLTVLATVKDELNITDTSQDDRLARWITETSDFISMYCDRVFAQETVREVWRLNSSRNDGFRPYGGYWDLSGMTPPALQLSRYPVTAIASITEDDATALTVDEYDTDSAAGLLYRMSGQDAGAGGYRAAWSGNKIAVEYTGGYPLLGGVPYALEQACLTLIKHRAAARGRDPYLRQQTIPGILEQAWWVPSQGGGGLPDEVRSLLDPFRRVLM